MKKLKRFENFDMSRRIGTPEYEQSVKDSYSALEKREQVVQSIVDEMTPKPEIICEEIMDIFESWKDEGVEFENIELVTLKDTGDEISVYYPLGWSGSSGKKYYHPSFGNTNVDNNIVSILEKNNQLYYRITFGVDILTRAKVITGATYYQHIDWSSKELDPLFNTMNEAAKELWERLNSMYNIECIRSRCFIKDNWKDCEPTLGNLKTGKLSWILKIKD
jgi:hypothetical protein